MLLNLHELLVTHDQPHRTRWLYLVNHQKLMYKYLHAKIQLFLLFCQCKPWVHKNGRYKGFPTHNQLLSLHSLTKLLVTLLVSYFTRLRHILFFFFHTIINLIPTVIELLRHIPCVLREVETCIRRRIKTSQ